MTWQCLTWREREKTSKVQRRYICYKEKTQLMTSGTLYMAMHRGALVLVDLSSASFPAEGRTRKQTLRARLTVFKCGIDVLLADLRASGVVGSDKATKSRTPCLSVFSPGLCVHVCLRARALCSQLCSFSLWRWCDFTNAMGFQCFHSSKAFLEHEVGLIIDQTTKWRFLATIALV